MEEGGDHTPDSEIRDLVANKDRFVALLKVQGDGTEAVKSALLARFPNMIAVFGRAYDAVTKLRSIEDDERYVADLSARLDKLKQAFEALPDETDEETDALRERLVEESSRTLMKLDSLTRAYQAA